MLKLRALIAADAQHLADWGMDEDFRIAAGWTKRSHDQHLRFHERLIKSNDDEPTRLAIIDGDQLVGYVDFTPDDVGSCELGIAIGPSARWGPAPWP